MVSLDFAHGNHRRRFGQAVSLADRSAHAAEKFRDVQVKGGAARHQHVDAVAEDALNRIGDLALEVGPHDEVKALAGSMFDRQPVFLAEPAPADFRCPVEEVALLLGHLAAHHQDLIVDALKDTRHRAHIGWVNRVQIIGDVRHASGECEKRTGGKRVVVGSTAFERVRQRQIRQEHIVFIDRHVAGNLLHVAHHVAVCEHHSLGTTRGAGGIHECGQIIGIGTGRQFGHIVSGG